MNEHEENDLRRQFGKVLAGLDNLGDEIRRQRLPGVAWQKPVVARKRPWRVLLWPVAAAGVAAAVLLAMFFLVSPPPGDHSILPVATNEPREDDLLVMEMLVGNVADTAEPADDSMLWIESPAEDSAATTQMLDG